MREALPRGRQNGSATASGEGGVGCRPVHGADGVARSACPGAPVGEERIRHRLLRQRAPAAPRPRRGTRDSRRGRPTPTDPRRAARASPRSARRGAREPPADRRRGRGRRPRPTAALRLRVLRERRRAPCRSRPRRGWPQCPRSSCPRRRRRSAAARTPPAAASGGRRSSRRRRPAGREGRSPARSSRDRSALPPRAPAEHRRLRRRPPAKASRCSRAGCSRRRAAPRRPPRRAARVLLSEERHQRIAIDDGRAAQYCPSDRRQEASRRAWPRGRTPPRRGARDAPRRRARGARRRLVGARPPGGPLAAARGAT